LLRYVIIRPVVKVSAVANEVSMGNLEAEEYERPGKDEIASLSQSFNRMRRSLESALKLLEDPPGV
jgi:protein-histidine pros-kinase